MHISAAGQDMLARQTVGQYDTAETLHPAIHNMMLYDAVQNI